MPDSTRSQSIRRARTSFAEQIRRGDSYGLLLALILRHLRRDGAGRPRGRSGPASSSRRCSAQCCSSHSTRRTCAIARSRSAPPSSSSPSCRRWCRRSSTAARNDGTTFVMFVLVDRRADRHPHPDPAAPRRSAWRRSSARSASTSCSASCSPGSSARSTTSSGGRLLRAARAEEQRRLPLLQLHHPDDRSGTATSRPARRRARHRDVRGTHRPGVPRDARRAPHVSLRHGRQRFTSRRHGESRGQQEAPPFRSRASAPPAASR